MHCISWDRLYLLANTVSAALLAMLQGRLFHCSHFILCLCYICVVLCRIQGFWMELLRVRTPLLYLWAVYFMTSWWNQFSELWKSWTCLCRKWQQERRWGLTWIYVIDIHKKLLRGAQDKYNKYKVLHTIWLASVQDMLILFKSLWL